MDLSLPLSAIARRTDAAALSVLAAAGEALTGRQIARLAEESTAANIRLALLRLVDAGLVFAAPRTDAVLYAANRRHIMWPAVEQALGARKLLLDNIRALVESKASLGTTVVLYGSVARGESSASSDVDLLLVQSESAITREYFADFLREDVRIWTGNTAQIFEITPDELRRMWGSGDPLVSAWLSEGLHIAGWTLGEHLGIG